MAQRMLGRRGSARLVLVGVATLGRPRGGHETGFRTDVAYGSGGAMWGRDGSHLAGVHRACVRYCRERLLCDTTTTTTDDQRERASYVNAMGTRRKEE